MADMIFCTRCGRLNEAQNRYCLGCGTPRDLNSAQRVAGIAFLLNEMQVPPLEDVLSDQQSDMIEDFYERQLETLTGRRIREPVAQEQPVAAPRATPISPARESTAAQPASPVVAPPARARQAPRPSAPPREPRDWSWLAEQQANLFLFAGAFLTVVAALIYVGYSGQAVGGALKMTLLVAYTLAFLAAGAFCLRLRRVATAGHVFFAVGAILVPMNFVAARNIVGGDSLSPESMWLAGSLVTALFYTSVAYVGLSRWYSFTSGAALISAALAAAVVTDAPVEWLPAGFIALALLMSLTDVAGTKTLRERVGPIWSKEGHVVAGVSILVAVVVAMIAGEGRYHYTGVTTSWFLPAAFAVLLAHAAIPTVAKRQREAGVVAIAGFVGVVSTVVYATHLPREYYAVAFGCSAALLGAAMILAARKRFAELLPENLRDALQYAGFGAVALSIIAMLTVFNQMSEAVRPYELHTRWFVAPSVALMLVFFLIDALARKHSIGAAGAAFATAGLAAGVVFGLDVSAEYYGLALVAAGGAMFAAARWGLPALPERLRPPDALAILIHVAEASIAGGMLAAVIAAAAAASNRSGFALQSHWTLLATFAAAAAALSVYITMRMPVLGEADRVGTYEIGLALTGAACGLVYGLGSSAEYYSFGLVAAAGSMLALVALVLPRINGDQPWRREDGLIAAHVAAAAGALVGIGAVLASVHAANGDSLAATAHYAPQSRWFLPALFATLFALYAAASMAPAPSWREAKLAAGIGLIASVFGMSTGIVYALDVSAEYYAFASLVPAIGLGAVAHLELPEALARMLHDKAQDGAIVAGRVAAVAGVAIAAGVALASLSADATFRPDSHAFLSVSLACAAVFFALDASRESRVETSVALMASISGAIVFVPWAFHASAGWYGVAFAAAGLLFGFGGRAWTPSWLHTHVRDAFAAGCITVAWLPFERVYGREPKFGAAVHLAAALFYAAAALTDRSKRDLNTLLELPSTISPIRLAMGWIYAAALTLGVGYVYVLRALPGSEDAGSGSLALPMMALMLGFALVGASARWWRSEFRMHLYVISLITAIGSLLPAPDPLTLASMLTVYVAAFATLAVWEGAPAVLAPSVVFAFIAVVAWRAQFDAALSAIPLAYCGLGVALLAAARALRPLPRWRGALGVAGSLFAIAAPAAGFGILAWHTHHGIAFGTRVQLTALYQWSTLTLAVAGALLLAGGLLESRRPAIVPASALLLAALLLEIAHFRPGNMQAYTLVIGSYLVLLGLVGIWKFRLLPEFFDAAPYIEAAGAATVMFPSFAQSFDGHWGYSIIVLAEAAAFLSAGVALKRRGVLSMGLSFLVLVAGHALFDAVNALPNWMVVMVAGVALLGVGVAILAGRDRWDAWQTSLLGWWNEAGNGHAIP
ncbi:MAG: hypothetical protein M3P30_12935 [Chloroflexota bacterium]|nr:hypothetical protein [Chloroflexota bacterium]